MANKFTIQLPCKSYVKAYLENNCGDPVDLDYLPDIRSYFLNNLKKPKLRRETSPIGNYSYEVTIKVFEDYIYRYGWELTKSSIVEINRRAEEQVKFIMRSYVSFNRSLGSPVSVCIRNFQERFGFPEHLWAYESIKKDFDRHGNYVNLRTLDNIKLEINKIFLDNLSAVGTISQKHYKELRNEYR